MTDETDRTDPTDEAPQRRHGVSYDEVHAWVSPQTWRSEDVAEHVIESIMASGSSDMDVWLLFVHAGEIAEARAELSEAMERRDEQIRVLYASGVPMARIAYWVNVSVMRVQQIITSGVPNENANPGNGGTVEG